MSVARLAASPPRAWPAVARAGAIVTLLLLQAAVLDRNYHFTLAVAGAPPPVWFWVNTALKWLAYAALFGAVAFALIVAAQRRRVGAAWLEAARAHAWGRWLAAEFALFTVLLAALPLLRAGAESPPWLVFTLWLAAGAAMLACAALALAPARFWRGVALGDPSAYVLALGVGALTFAALPLSQNSWDALSEATFRLSHAILQLYEPTTFVEPGARLLGAGDFVVSIHAACSGYEGMALVLSMLGFYIYAFRRDLRFPHVLLLLPIGMAAIWLSNALRIAMLVSIGAHVSPEMAINGFHAQAGWVMFLVVTVSLMALAHQVRFFRAQVRPRAEDADAPALRLTAALLAPFAALMAARIGASFFGESAYWIAVAALAAPAAVLWLYRKTIRPLIGRIEAEPVLIGLAIGWLWIATEPAGESALGAWLAQQPPALAALWLVLRIAGFALIVPIAEELAFRGYLHRALAGRRFEAVAPAAFTWTAFIVTSVLFGAMHGRWLAGMLAGAAFAFALYRSKSLTGPIAAHIAANGLIAAYALMTRDWASL